MTRPSLVACGGRLHPRSGRAFRLTSLARFTLVGLFSIWVGAAACAESARWAKCRARDADARIAGCSEIIARAGRETKSDRMRAYLNRSSAFRAKGELDRAIADLDKALQLDPMQPVAFAERGSIYQAKGDFDRAIADFDRALQFDKNLTAAYIGRGKAHRAKGEIDQALADFTEAVRLDPASASLRVDRGAIYQAKGDLERARQDIETALKLDPQLASAKAALEELNRESAKKAAPPRPEAPAQRSPLTSAVLFRAGPVPITRPVATTWAIMLALSVSSWLVTRRLQLGPNRRQAVLELLVTGIMTEIESLTRKDARPFLPLIGTLFIFLVTANLSAMLPGVEAPTSKLETPAALALIVFFSVHFFGIRTRGFLGYLASFAEPSIIMAPLNVASEITRTFSLMARLFGNIMSGEFVIGLVVALAGLFVPIPLMMLEILLGVIQAYIFTVLATVFIGAAIGGDEKG